MLVTGFPAGMFQTNCYILAADGSSECVVVDPGQDAVGPLRKLLDDAGVTPAAVVLTHGHLDHIWSAQPVCDEFGIPAYIHPDDRHLLSDPASGIGPTLSGFIEGVEFREPGTVKDLCDGDVLELAGIEFRVDHTPGHTRGSVVLRITANTTEGPLEVAFTGDTLFAGSVGRTDLPGGNHQQMLSSIASKLLPLPDSTVILPGHGESSTMGRERFSNPFLAGIAASR